jgi:hypothetical protein
LPAVYAPAFSLRALPSACLHSDGLTYQPTFFLSGIIALPIVAVARLRGSQIKRAGRSPLFSLTTKPY